MSMTETDAQRAQAYRRSAAMPPIVPQEEIDRRAQAKAESDDWRTMATIEDVERRVGITRKADYRGLQQGEVIDRFHGEPRFTIGQMLFLAAVLGGGAWVAFCAWLGWV